MAKTYVKDYTNTFLIHGHEYSVTAPARFDSETHELVEDSELDDQAVEIANAMYRQEMSLVSPMDIKKYRAKIGLSQRNLLNCWAGVRILLQCMRRVPFHRKQIISF